jgi:hypothetical protein
MTDAKPKRRWFRFSLRMLLVLLTVLCVWLGLKVNLARQQREAVEAIYKAGGSVVFDYQYLPKSNPVGSAIRDYTINLDAAAPAPSWLRFLMGDDCFRTVIAVYFNSPKSSISKTDFDQIAKLPALKQFVLEPGTTGQHYQGSDLAALAQLDHLEVLCVCDTHLTAEMLAQLHCLDQLNSIVISNCDVDDSGMEQIGKMTNLRFLALDGTRITDAGLRHLRKLTELKELYLHRTQISDDGLHNLADMKLLTILSISETHVTKSGAHELQKAFPNTNIWADWRKF